MKQISKCEFNIDTASVEIRFTDGSDLSIYCPDVEDEIAHTPAQRAELDWLIYNEPLTYAALVLTGVERSYLNGPFLHSLED